MADLFGTYDKRIKLTIDHTKIDADLSWFPVTVFLSSGDSINVGAEAIDRDGAFIAGNTLICRGISATGTGKLRTVEIYADTDITGAIVATFYQPDPTGSPNYLVARDHYEIGSVPAGSKQIFSVDLDVEEGDYLGIYYTDGRLEGDATGGSGVWYKSGNHTEDEGTYYVEYGYGISLYATSFIGHGEEVFAEFDSDEDFDRIAFTTSDGVTQLYADCELFDVSEQKAIYHVSKTGWTVSSSTDTDIYLYYDNTAGHNTTYISKSGGTAAQSVWDSDFKAVYHMQDNTTSTILDSTSNANHGTKKGINEPAEATGKVGQGQDFDGTDDYINLGNNTSITTDLDDSGFTFEAVVNVDDLTDVKGIIDNDSYALLIYDTDSDSSCDDPGIGVYATGGWKYKASANTIAASTYNYIAGISDGSNIALQVNDNTRESSSLGAALQFYASDVKIGIKTEDDTSDPFDGIIDEVRISSIARSAAWIAATYDSLWDTLLTHGSEETGGTGEATNVLFIFSNF